MADKITEQLQTILDNKTAIFSEFLSNEDNFSKFQMIGAPDVSIVYDINNIHPNNTSLMTTITPLLDGTLDIMSISIANHQSEVHPKEYILGWDLSYPIKRFIISNVGNNTVGAYALRQPNADEDIQLPSGGNIVEFFDWKTPTEKVDFGESDTSSSNNLYLVIDIFDPDSNIVNDDNFKTNYMKYYEHYYATETPSAELQEFFDVN